MLINILGFEGHWASVTTAQFCCGRANAAIFWDNLWRSNSDQKIFYSGSRERRLRLVDFVLQVTSQPVACIWVRCPHLWLGTLVMRNRHGGLKEALDKHVWPVPLNWLQPTFQAFPIDALSQAQLFLLPVDSPPLPSALNFLLRPLPPPTSRSCPALKAQLKWLFTPAGSHCVLSSEHPYHTLFLSLFRHFLFLTLLSLLV